MMYQKNIEMAVTANDVMNAADVFIMEIRLKKDIISIAKRKEYERDVEMVCAMLEDATMHTETRAFWIDVFCEILLTTDLSICDKVKKFVNERTMSARDMHHYCFYIMCQSAK